MTGPEQVRTSVLAIKMDVFMLLSFCKIKIWLELARETHNSNYLIFSMHSWLPLDLEFFEKIMHFALMIGPKYGDK